MIPHYISKFMLDKVLLSEEYRASRHVTATRTVLRRRMSAFFAAERGMTLIELLVGLAILAITAVSFLGGASTALQSVQVTDRRVIAQALAKSEVEYVLSAAYDSVNNPPAYIADPTLTIPDRYSVTVQAERLDPKSDGTSSDDGLQSVTVTVRYDGNDLLAVQTYKANR